MWFHRAFKNTNHHLNGAKDQSFKFPLSISFPRRG